MQETTYTSTEKGKWMEIIEHAELKIKKHQQRIRDLQAAIRSFKKLREDGVPWPEGGREQDLGGLENSKRARR